MCFSSENEDSEDFLAGMKLRDVIEERKMANFYFWIIYVLLSKKVMKHKSPVRMPKSSKVFGTVGIEGRQLQAHITGGWMSYNACPPSHPLEDRLKIQE